MTRKKINIDLPMWSTEQNIQRGIIYMYKNTAQFLAVEFIIVMINISKPTYEKSWLCKVKSFDLFFLKFPVET